MSVDKVKLPDHIEEFIDSRQQSEQVVISKELFDAEKDNVDLRTDLKPLEIVYLNILEFNNEVLVKAGLKGVYSDVIEKYMRLKVSQDRKSRSEYVDISRRERFEQNAQKFANIKTIMDAKT